MVGNLALKMVVWMVVSSVHQKVACLAGSKVELMAVRWADQLAAKTVE